MLEAKLPPHGETFALVTLYSSSSYFILLAFYLEHFMFPFHMFIFCFVKSPAAVLGAGIPIPVLKVLLPRTRVLGMLPLLALARTHAVRFQRSFCCPNFFFYSCSAAARRIARRHGLNVDAVYRAVPSVAALLPVLVARCAASTFSYLNVLPLVPSTF